jgi:hypothetical protein
MGLMTSRYKFVCFFFLISYFYSFAQDKSYISISGTPGFLLAHRADLKNLAAHNYGVDISIEKEKENSDWGSFYNKPSIGHGLLYYNLGKEQTGHAFGFLSHIKFNIISFRDVDVRFRMGAGLAYITKKFDVYENRRNQAIGSHLNGSMQFGLVARKELSNNDYIETGLSVSHYSNAAFKVPNLGYNIPSLTFRYGFHRRNQNDVKIEPPQDLSKVNWCALLIYGRKQRNFASPKDFNLWGFQLRGLLNKNKVKSWRFGLDYTMDKSYMHSINPDLPSNQVSILDQSEFALVGGYQWGFGNVNLIAELGAYIYKPTILKNALSQRLGLSYKLNKYWYTQGMLRFHRGVADFFEIGLGYQL